MKVSRKKISVILVLAVGFLSTGCPGFEEGFRRPACIYEDTALEAYISDYTLEDDSVVHISFEPLEPLAGIMRLRLDRYDLEDFHLNLDQSIVEDTSIIYLLEGSVMTQGSCSPTSISSVQRIE